MNRPHPMKKALCCDIPSRNLNKCGCEKADRGCQSNTVSRYGREESCPSDAICECANRSRNESFDKEFALGIAYVPVQEWKGIVCPETALKNGTVFEELIKPFTGYERRRIHG